MIKVWANIRIAFTDVNIRDVEICSTSFLFWKIELFAPASYE